MTRIDVCDRDDAETTDKLLAVIAELGGRGEGDPEGPGLGVGLNRFRFGKDEVTVFVDAWGVDLAGPDELVGRITAAMAGRRGERP